MMEDLTETFFCWIHCVIFLLASPAFLNNEFETFDSNGNFSEWPGPAIESRLIMLKNYGCFIGGGATRLKPENGYNIYKVGLKPPVLSGVISYNLL